MEKQQRLKGLKVRTLKQEVKTRFTATHTMVRSILNDPKEKKDEEMDMEKVRLNIEAINQAMIDSKFKKEELAKLTIKEDDVRKTKDLVNISDVLEEGITLIGGEKFATGSAVLPFLNKFLKLLEDDETDSLYISSFKRSLKTELESRCEVNLNKKVLAKASFFDKRFFQLKFFDQADIEEVLKEIKDELKELEEKVNASKNIEEPAKKKKRFLGIGLSDSDDEEIKGVEKEMDDYQSERKLKSDGSPFDWEKPKITISSHVKTF